MAGETGRRIDEDERRRYRRGRRGSSPSEQEQERCQKNAAADPDQAGYKANGGGRQEDCPPRRAPQCTFGRPRQKEADNRKHQRARYK